VKRIGVLIGLVLALGALPVFAEEEAPPADAKPLSEILLALEKKGYSRVSEAIFQNGAWKIEAYKANDRRILQVDAKSGEIKGDRKDDDD
jgi:hypothetical protein